MIIFCLSLIVALIAAFITYIVINEKRHKQIISNLEKINTDLFKWLPEIDILKRELTDYNDNNRKDVNNLRVKISQMMNALTVFNNGVPPKQDSYLDF